MTNKLKNLHLDLVRVTETGAISAAEWVGRGDKKAADKAATEAMRERLNQMDMVAEIAIGEGKKDESFGLFEGELVGLSARMVSCDFPPPPDMANNHDDPRWSRPKPDYSIAVDPIEGTTPTATGGYEAMSVIAMGERDCFLKTEEHYLYKFAVGPEAIKGNPHLMSEIPLEATVTMLAGALDKPLNRVTVCLLDRPRHAGIVESLRKVGCRIKFIQDCDVTACIATCVPDSGIDMYVGVGGAPEAMIAAAAMKCMGGHFEVRFVDKDYRPTGGVMKIEDLAKGPVTFAATGITDGLLLNGVHFGRRGAVTNSITMRSDSGTVRRITTEHGN